MSAPKLTAVGRLLDRDHPEAPVSLPISQEKYQDPTFIPRLSFRSLPRIPTDVESLAGFLSKHTDHALFIDTNLTWLPKEWWYALLAEPGRVHVSGRVVRELVPFFQRHREEHPLRDALVDHHPGITLHPDPEDRVAASCQDYYVWLLVRRRLLLQSSIEHFANVNGRRPSPEEVSELKMKLQQTFGDRTFALNKKVVSPYRTDETLIFQAVHHAVTTGQPTKVLSGDLDVEEQFYMMLRLLTAHYYGQLIADEYIADFARFDPHPVSSSSTAPTDHLFDARCASVIDLGDRRIHDFIPKLTTFVPISCSTIGQHYTSELTYGAETTMATVFAMKSATFGLSTDKLAGRNIHPWGIPEGLCKDVQNEALVARDRYVELPDSKMRLARLDMALTMWPGDPHVRIAAPENTPRYEDSRLVVPPSGHRGIVPLHARRPPDGRLWAPAAAA